VGSAGAVVPEAVLTTSLTDADVIAVGITVTDAALVAGGEVVIDANLVETDAEDGPTPTVNPPATTVNPTGRAIALPTVRLPVAVASQEEALAEETSS